MDSGFTTGQLALLESLLEARRVELGARIAAQRDGRTRVEQARDLLAQDGDDAPQRDADREVDLALTDAEIVELGRIDRAIQRVHQPDFGRCMTCGAAIPFDRLRIEPTAERCVPCESAREKAAGGPRRASL